ncbi:hypothetical protein [Enterobacter cloacae complex sp. 363J6]|uniref:hypothetical protein n=1 Tax=Enterobacter cloacae complex sp. 363J6 TaxID=3395868 RepID=UPI003CF6D4D1
MKFLQSTPDYWQNIRAAKTSIKEAKDLWNDGNVLAGRTEDGEQTYFKKPYGIFAAALAYNMGYAMLVLATIQKWVEVPMKWIGTLLIRLVRFMFGVVIVILVSPIFLVSLTINVKTGVNTKFGNLLVKKNEKNSDKA